MADRSAMTILVADDDPDDRLMVREAVEEAHLPWDLRFAKDGEELLDYLRRRGVHAKSADSPRPSLILLDLNLPRKDGREVLHEIKTDACLRQIPVIVLTTSSAEQDVFLSYDLGANMYVVKPSTFSTLVEFMTLLGQLAADIARLPPLEILESHDRQF